MIIRPAEPADLSSVFELDPLPAERVAEVLERRMLVADVDGFVQGYISWQEKGFIGNDYVNRLVVREARRRQGLARLLINSLTDVLRGRVFISAPNDNIAAVNLLGSTGWHRAGEIVGLLPEGESEVFFYKDLMVENDRLATNAVQFARHLASTA